MWKYTRDISNKQVCEGLRQKNLITNKNKHVVTNIYYNLPHFVASLPLLKHKQSRNKRNLPGAVNETQTKYFFAHNARAGTLMCFFRVLKWNLETTSQKKN
jgi:hypothetical protein